MYIIDERNVVVICGRIHLNSRQVSAVVRIWRPFLNEESISTKGDGVLRDSLLSSGS